MGGGCNPPTPPPPICLRPFACHLWLKWLLFTHGGYDNFYHGTKPMGGKKNQVKNDFLDLYAIYVVFGLTTVWPNLRSVWKRLACDLLPPFSIVLVLSVSSRLVHEQAIQDDMSVCCHAPHQGTFGSLACRSRLGDIIPPFPRSPSSIVHGLSSTIALTTTQLTFLLDLHTHTH